MERGLGGPQRRAERYEEVEMLDFTGARTDSNSGKPPPPPSGSIILQSVLTLVC
jgi:hypothetical protein